MTCLAGATLATTGACALLCTLLLHVLLCCGRESVGHTYSWPCFRHTQLLSWFDTGAESQLFGSLGRLFVGEPFRLLPMCLFAGTAGCIHCYDLLPSRNQKQP